MSRWWLTICSLMVVALIPFTLGCGPKAKPPGPAVDDHGHHHHHDHGHGEEGGHLIEVGDADDHHLEWNHDDKANKIMFVVRAKDAKTEVPVAMEKLVVTVAVAGKPSKDFDVPAENLKDGKASRFTVVDEQLLVAMEVGEGVSTKVKIGEKEHTIAIEHKEHGHDEHKHDHKDEKGKEK